MSETTFTTAPSGDRFRDRFMVFSNTTIYGRGRDVLLCAVDHQDSIVSVVEPLQMVRKPFGEFDSIVIPPTISGPWGNDFLQAALDAAWAAGLRPKNWRLETTEQVAAMDNHLQDMRRLVFAASDLDLPNPLKEKANVG